VAKGVRPFAATTFEFSTQGMVSWRNECSGRVELRREVVRADEGLCAGFAECSEGLHVAWPVHLFQVIELALGSLEAKMRFDPGALENNVVAPV
jgi:hypothetical protein